MAGYLLKKISRSMKPNLNLKATIPLYFLHLVKNLKISPEILAKNLGENLLKNNPGFISGYNVIKAFLNLSITEESLLSFLKENYKDVCFGKKPLNHKKVMVEYSSPNTNKPLHLGHLRNNFLGWSVAEILKGKWI